MENVVGEVCQMIYKPQKNHIKVTVSVTGKGRLILYAACASMREYEVLRNYYTSKHFIAFSHRDGIICKAQPLDYTCGCVIQ
jgi:hypothetical protein